MIYTKTGDKGDTSLANGKRISKADARIEAYGTVDELNSWVGFLRAQLTHDQLAETNAQLAWLQNKLFNLGAALSLAPGEWIEEKDVSQIEQWIDAIQAVVPKQRAFLLPAGNEIVCRCHICRTICRRAERKMVALECDEQIMKFINRTSDYLFVLARYVNYVFKEEEEEWKR
jgi:cob(I)alamin adenosyltransferase